MEKKSILYANLHKKRVFLRADLNITGPHDERLLALIPTLEFLTQRTKNVIICTHRGRPDPLHPDPALSTQPLVAWLQARGFACGFIDGDRPLTLLENIRFDPGEMGHSPALAQRLASMADYYVNDAFGTLHREDTSIALLPLQFAPQHRFYGLCVMREIEMLQRLRATPAKPYVAVLGGNKLEDKLPLITRLLQAPEHARVNHLLLGGALAQPLLENKNHELLRMAQRNGITVALPTDGTGRDIGPQTIRTFTGIIATARTIFANGTMGVYEEADNQAGTRAILTAIAHCKGFTILGGGDCAAAAALFGVRNKVSFVSTGGGATLAFLAAIDPYKELPGLRALCE